LLFFLFAPRPEIATYLKEYEERVWKSFKVKNVINTRDLLYVRKLRHSNDGVDGYQKEEKAANVKERRKRHHQCKEQGSNSLQIFKIKNRYYFYLHVHMLSAVFKIRVLFSSTLVVVPVAQLHCYQKKVNGGKIAMKL